MKIPHELSAQYLEAYVDLTLIVNQVRGEFKVRHEELVPYHAVATKIMGLFKTFHIEYILLNQNSYADALVSLATSLALQPGTSKEILVHTHKLYCPKSSIEEIPTPIEDIQDKGKEVFETTIGPALKD